MRKPFVPIAALVALLVVIAVVAEMDKERSKPAGYDPALAAKLQGYVADCDRGLMDNNDSFCDSMRRNLEGMESVR